MSTVKLPPLPHYLQKTLDSYQEDHVTAYAEEAVRQALAAQASVPVADLRHELNQLGMFAHTALNLDAGDMRNNMDDLADRLLALAGGAPTLSAPVAEPEDTREDFDTWCKKHGYVSAGSVSMLWSAWSEALKQVGYGHKPAPVDTSSGHSSKMVRTLWGLKERYRTRGEDALSVATRAMQMIRRSKLDPFERQQHDKLIQDFAALHERPPKENDHG